MSTAALFTTAKVWKQPIGRRVDKTAMVHCPSILRSSPNSPAWRAGRSQQPSFPNLLSSFISLFLQPPQFPNHATFFDLPVSLSSRGFLCFANTPCWLGPAQSPRCGWILGLFLWFLHVEFVAPSPRVLSRSRSRVFSAGFQIFFSHTKPGTSRGTGILSYLNIPVFSVFHVSRFSPVFDRTEFSLPMTL